MKARNPAGPLLLHAGAEQVGEQMVVAPPAAHLIQRHQEQAGLFHPLQHRLAIGAAGDRITQPAGQAFQQRGFQQEGAQLLLLAVQHLLGQVVQDIAVAAAEGRHEPREIRLPPQRKGGQLQAGHPAFGAGRQRRHRRGGQVSTSRFTEQRRRLLCGEPQVGGAQLGELPAGPQPRQRQRRVGPAGQHQVQSRRQVLKQEPKRDVHLLGVDQVVIVEDQQHLAVTALGGQLVDQRRHQPLKRWRRRRAQQRADSLPDPRARPVQRGNHVPPQPHRVVVGRVQRQPGHRAVARPGPVRPAGSSCRTRPGRTPGSAAAPALRRAPPPAAGGARTPAAGAVRAAWSPARHPARNRQPQQELPQRTQRSATHPLSTTSDSQPSPTGEPIVRPARLADRGRRVCGCQLTVAEQAEP